MENLYLHKVDLFLIFYHILFSKLQRLQDYYTFCAYFVVVLYVAVLLLYCCCIFVVVVTRVTKCLVVSQGPEFTTQISKQEVDLTAEMIAR